MEIFINGTPKEIADLESQLQSQRQFIELLSEDNHTITETIKEYHAKE